MDESPVCWREGPMYHRTFPMHAGRVLDAKRARYAEKLLEADVYRVEAKSPATLKLKRPA